MKWIKKYIGSTWDQYNCWQLVREILREEFKYNIPYYDDKYKTAYDLHLKKLIDSESKKWILIELGKEMPGDVVYTRFKKFSTSLNKIVENGHVGLVVRPGEMIHIIEGFDVNVEKYYSKKWRSKIIGIYRWPTS